MTLALYRVDGLWHFDDAERGITGEPFVSSATAAIDALIAEPCDRAMLEFDEEEFDGASPAVFIGVDCGGFVYRIGDIYATCVSEKAAWKRRERLIRYGYTPKRDAPYRMLKGEFIAAAHAQRRIALVLDEHFQIVERYDPL